MEVMKTWVSLGRIFAFAPKEFLRKVNFWEYSSL